MIDPVRRKTSRLLLGAVLVGTLTVAGVTASLTAGASQSGRNSPWYPSLAAFEHHDSGRTHLFPDAYFGGAFNGQNTVQITKSTAQYPSGWNITYLNANSVYLYGGGDGNEQSSIGSFVAKVNPNTLKPIWYRQLVNTARNGQWDYPGTIGILNDGFLYVIYGYHLTKLNPQTGSVIATVALPTGGAAAGDTAYNGFNAAPDGIIVVKSIYRPAGCTVQGPDALVKCPDPSAVPSSELSTVDTKTMTVIATVTMPGEVIGRVTLGSYASQEYAYFFTQEGFIRYKITPAGMLTLDPSWATGPLLTSGQTVGWATVVMGNWVITQCNGLPASAPLSVYAVNQGAADDRFTVQPFAGDRIPPLVKKAYAKQGPGGTQAVSFIPSTLSADPDTDTIYAMDAIPGEIAAIKLTSSGLTTIWKVHQTTTEFIAIIGPLQRRAIVATDVPTGDIPGHNRFDEVVWRKAATGQVLARSPKLPAMTSATMVQPYYRGGVFYPGVAGTLYRLQPTDS